MRAGAVGDFCGYHIDVHGNVLDIPINHRVLGMSVEDIRAIPHIVGVAGGVVKALTILGCCARGWWMCWLPMTTPRARCCASWDVSTDTDTRTGGPQAAEIKDYCRSARHARGLRSHLNL